MLDKQIIESYRKSGSIAKEVLDSCSRLVQPGASVLDIIEKTEQRIKDLGAELACPATLSFNETAAHDTADIADKRIVNENDIVKLDLTVMINGYIADTANTICLDKDRSDLKKAAEAAVDSALKNAKPGVYTSELGHIIEDTITSRGFQPIRNLSGHMLNRYILHAGISIPNFDDRKKIMLEEGMVFAIEPFATDGKGSIRESRAPLIFRYLGGSARLNSARKILDLGKNKFHSLPFAKRWIDMNPLMLNNSLSLLYTSGNIEQYPPLVEVSDGFVAQQEHTVIVMDKPIVTTK